MSSGDDRTIRLWEVATGRCLLTIPTTGDHPSVSFCGDAMILASVYGTSLDLWDLNYFNRHIAGNLEYQLAKLNAEDDENAKSLRAWAATVLANGDPDRAD